MDRRGFLKTMSKGALGAVALTLPFEKSSNASETNWFEKIHRPLNIKNLQGKEKSHTPMISFTEDKKRYLQVKVGQKDHPMEAGHYITNIEVWVDSNFISRVTFTAHAPLAAVIIPVKIKKGSTLRVLSRCNKHGLWESKKVLT